jgi:predicted nucleic acid-binding protein
MTFADLLSGAPIFIDANIFIYAFGPDPTWGLPCNQMLDRIDRQDLQGFTSAHVLSDVAHRLMTLEACATLGWPSSGVARRLKQHPAEVQRLARYRQALDEIALIGIQVLPVTGGQVSRAADLSRQFGLLSSDALIVTVMGSCPHEPRQPRQRLRSRPGPHPLRPALMGQERPEPPGRISLSPATAEDLSESSWELPPDRL